MINFYEQESKTFKIFTFASFFLIIMLNLLLSIYSSKYRVSNIRYVNTQALNYGAIEEIIDRSIWLIRESDFEKFYNENLNVENLIISKELPNTVVIDVVVYEKIINITDLRDTRPKNIIVYKNLYTEEKEIDQNLSKLTITNGPIPNGFYSELISFVLTIKKYDISINKLSLVYDGDSLDGQYDETSLKIGLPKDLSKKGTVLGYILEGEPCLGDIRILDSISDDIETISNCQ